MKSFTRLQAVVVLSSLLMAGSAFAAPAVKTYQVTGPVLEVTDSMIVVQKNEDKWAIARDANTKVNGTLKVGDRVTIEYRMVATTVEVKKEAKEQKEPKK